MAVIKSGGRGGAEQRWLELGKGKTKQMRRKDKKRGGQQGRVWDDGKANIKQGRSWVTGGW